MIIDLDQWMRDESAVDLGGRLFPYDVFISHRRFDLPKLFLDQLSDHGARIVWDCDLDVRDRRVMHAISRAMRRCRYVALYVSDSYADSPWCAAEYLSALFVEQQFNVQRALCVNESAHAIACIPKPMAKQPRFPGHDNGTVTMASFVTTGNRAGINTKLDSVLRRISGDMLSPQMDRLSREEHLNILEQRLFYWLTSENPQTNISNQGRASREVMSAIGEPYGEVEDIVREIRKVVLAPGPTFRRNEGIGEAELRRVVSIAELVASSLSTRHRAEIARASEKWLYDFLLKPLLLAVTIDSLRTAATQAYQSVCEAMRLGQQADEVPIYIRVLQAVVEGSLDIESVVRQGTLWITEDR